MTLTLMKNMSATSQATPAPAPAPAAGQVAGNKVVDANATAQLKKVIDGLWTANSGRIQKQTIGVLQELSSDEVKGSLGSDVEKWKRAALEQVTTNGVNRIQFSLPKSDADMINDIKTEMKVISQVTSTSAPANPTPQPAPVKP